MPGCAARCHLPLVMIWGNLPLPQKEDCGVGGPASWGSIPGCHPGMVSRGSILAFSLHWGDATHQVASSFTPQLVKPSASKPLHLSFPSQDSNLVYSFFLLGCSVSHTALSEGSREEGSWSRWFALLTQIVLTDFRRGTSGFFLSRDCCVGSIVTLLLVTFEV